MSKETKKPTGAGTNATATSKTEKKAKAEAKAASRPKPKGRIATELSRQGGAIACTVLLVLLSAVALAVPGWGVPLGTLLGGGNQVTLTATKSDGSEVSADELASARANLQKRADALFEKGVSVKQTGDDALSVRVPASDDAATVASSIAGAGKVELVRVDAIGDADALAQIQAGTTNVRLKDGTYTAFASSDNITDSRVVSGTSSARSSSMVYAVGITLDSAAAKQLADITAELSSSYGRIAVVVDGTVVTAPQVSQKIEGGQVTFSGGFTRSQAYALAAEISAGPIRVTLAASDPEPLSSGLSGQALPAAIAAAVVLALLAGLVCSRLFGRAGWVAALSVIVTLVLQLGAFAVLAQFGYVILGTYELAAVVVCELVSIVSSGFAAARYASERRGGSSVRKAQQEACDHAIGRIALVEAVLCVVAIVCAFVAPGVWRELSWALSAGLLADLVSMPLVKAPMLRVLTAADAEAGVAAAGVSLDAGASADEE